MASSHRLANKVAAKLPGLPVAPMGSISNLGIDCTAGKMRVISRLKTRKGRFAKAALRKKRLMAAVAAAGGKAVKLFTAGVRPTVNYGAVATGLSDRELLAQRRLVSKGMPLGFWQVFGRPAPHQG